jgi:hypothetical protein
MCFVYDQHYQQKVRTAFKGNQFQGESMTAEKIVQRVGGMFSPWKLKSTLKNRSTGAKAVFSVNDGKYSVKVTA